MNRTVLLVTLVPLFNLIVFLRMYLFRKAYGKGGNVFHAVTAVVMNVILVLAILFLWQ